MSPIFSKRKSPDEMMLERHVEEMKKSAQMDRELAKYGTKVPGGYVMDRGQLEKFFQDHPPKGIRKLERRP